MEHTYNKHLGELCDRKAHQQAHNVHEPHRCAEQQGVKHEQSVLLKLPEPFHSLCGTDDNMTFATQASPTLSPSSQDIPSVDSLLPCRVCGRSGCRLMSHLHYARGLSSPRSSLQGDDSVQRLLSPKLYRPSSFSKPATQYPLVMNSERQRLLALWSQAWGRPNTWPERHLFPICWIDLLLPAALGHAPLFQALLATSASIWALSHPLDNDIGPRHVQLAFQMLSDVSQASISTKDECILAYLCLTFVLSAQGNISDTEKHFANIVHLVALRGGPYYLGQSGIVAELLLRVDAIQAILFARAPTYSMSLPPLEVGPPPRLGSAFRALMSSKNVNRDILLAADSVCRIADIFELSLSASSSRTGSTNALGYLSSVTEYQLALHNSTYAGTTTWNEIICLALLIFNYVILHSHGGTDAIIETLERRFWNAVTIVLTQMGVEHPPRHLILWTLITGLTASIYSTSEYRATGIESLRVAMSGASFRGWQDFVTLVLDQHLWIRAAQEEIFCAIWLEVGSNKIGGPDPFVRMSGLP